MDKIYFLCEFEYGGKGNFYQEIQNGQLVRLVNMDGSTLEPTDFYGYKIISSDFATNLEFPQTL
jgi:hypothetical protein